jgi:uncharacterized UPF0160 family protein
MTKLAPIRDICTHSGSFHADDVFSLAVLLTLWPHARVVRSRDPNVWGQCDLLVDVGNEYAPEKGRFDHHQAGFEDEREGIRYASSGLIWKTFGAAYLEKMLGAFQDATLREATWSAIDRKLVQPLDLTDTGQGRPDWGYSTLPSLVFAFNATWREESAAEETQRFLAAVKLVQELLAQVTRSAHAEVQAEQLVVQAQELFDGKVLVLPQVGLPWREAVLAHRPKALFVVYARSGGDWGIQVVPKAVDSFEARKDLPTSWGGKNGKDLAGLTGVPDAVFCHKQLFIASAQSQHGALRLAEQALQA